MSASRFSISVDRGSLVDDFGQGESMELSKIPWYQTGRRWVACVDLLGFSQTVRQGDWPSIISVYEQSLEQLVDGAGHRLHVDHAWFSDTFLLYTSDDSAASFADIEMRTRFFVQGLLLRHIPMRGALSCGDFFAHPDSTVFIGPALVDAYRLCEDQDWIGFVLSPSAIEQMKAVGLPPDDRLNYRYWPVPRKTGTSPGGTLLAMVLGGLKLAHQINHCREAISHMRKRVAKDHVRRKYDRALEFLEKCGTVRILPNKIIM
jgi:hypothetical protein